MNATENAWLDPQGRLISSPRITALASHEVFAFGSNGAGRHRGGAAQLAHQRFGAVWGEGHGMHGQTYAIDTMSGREVMFGEIATFLEFAHAHPELTFLVTEVECGIAGYAPRDVAPTFFVAPDNVALPASFVSSYRGAQ